MLPWMTAKLYSKLFYRPAGKQVLPTILGGIF